MDFIEDLKWRDLFKDCTDETGLREKLKTPITCYCGFDPTADSLHIGHLQQIMLLKRYQVAGHRPIALCGGGTGMIGDPRPTTERKLLTSAEVSANVVSIKKQLSSFLDFDNDKALLLNNYDWLKEIDLLVFLRDYGKYFNVAYMLNKDTISSRLQSGISFTEFTYTILQAIDWLKLYQNYDCVAQIGGSDQWGNLTSGSELIRKVEGDKAKVFGITSPLITKSDGSKFGKSEGKNIWLDKEKTSAYLFYQFWLNVSDEDVIPFLKRLTLISREEIISLEDSKNNEAHLRIAQKSLAEYLTVLVHGQPEFENALKITQTLFKGDIKELNVEQLKEGLVSAPTSVIEDNTLLPDVLVQIGACKSKREARQLISGNSIAVNGDKQKDLEFVVSKKDAFNEELTIIKKGKKSWFVVKYN
jgi:tyrosyl-tRNA synthetase